MTHTQTNLCICEKKFLLRFRIDIIWVTDKINKFLHAFRLSLLFFFLTLYLLTKRAIEYFESPSVHRRSVVYESVIP